MEKEIDPLDVTVDSKLKFDSHIAKICLKVSQQIAVLKRMKKMFPFETRMKLYQAFIVPHLIIVLNLGISAANAWQIN